MRVPTVTILTLATLAASQSNSQASPNVESATPNLNTNRPEDDNFVATKRIESISVPESLIAQSNAPSSFISQPSLVQQIPSSTLSNDDLEKLKELIEETVNQQLASERIRIANEISSRLSELEKIYNILQGFVAILLLFAGGAIAILWKVRKTAVRQLVYQVRRDLAELGKAENQFETYTQMTNNLIAKIDQRIDTQKEPREREGQGFAQRLDSLNHSTDEIKVVNQKILQQLQGLVQILKREVSELLLQELEGDPVVTASGYLEEKEEVVTPEVEELTSSETREELTAQDYLKQGQVLAFDGEYDRAIALYDRAIQLEPDFYEAWYHRGNVFGKLPDYEGALMCYEKAISLQGDRYEVWYNCGWILRKLERCEEAIASYDKAISLEPERSEVWSDRGDLLEQLEREEEALACYSKATAIQPEDVESWYRQGVILEGLEGYDRAIDCYEKVLAIQPERVEAWYRRGQILELWEREEEAIACYDRVICLRSDNLEAWHRKGQILVKGEREEEAIVCYEEMIAIQPDNLEAWYHRGNLLAKLEREEEAIECYDRIIALAPDRPEIWRNRGILLEKMRRYEEAIESYEKAISSDPDDYISWRSRGTSLAELQQYTEAISCFSKAMEIQQKLGTYENDLAQA